MASGEGKKTLQERIGQLKVLQGADWQTPPPSKALSLIRRLANDPGIVAIMKKYDWRIGSLEEMPPEGLVGIDSVCVLGYNAGKGMMVALRLRTDNRLGFRNYHDIRATLLHELAHNEISEHDQSFWILVSKLNKEVKALDWTKSSGRTTGRTRKASYYDTLNPSERGDSSSEEDEPLLEDPDHEGYLLGGSVGHYRSRLLNLIPVKPVTDSSKSDEIRSTANQTNSSSTVEITSSPPRLSSSMDITPNTPADTSLTSQNRPKMVRTYWKCTECLYRNELNLDHCLSCNLIAPWLKTQDVIDSEAKANEQVGMDVTDIHDPVVQRANAMESKLRQLVQNTDIAGAKTALSTLLSMINNILNHPYEDKFKTVSFSNRAFYSKVGRHLAAIDFLKEVGFVDEQSVEKIIFKRNDLGLLWVAKSCLSLKLEIIESTMSIEVPTQ